MPAQLGGQKISALLESLPGIASVLRSPVADAIVNTIRAGVGLGDFREGDANELVQFAVRRGLLGPEEGEQLLAEVQDARKMAKKMARKRARKRAKKKATATVKTKRGVKKKAKVKTPKAKVARKTTAKKTKTTKSKAKRAKKKR